jgi:chromosome segregation ATPase
MTNHGMQTMSLKETAKLIKETRLLVDEGNKNSTMEAQLNVILKAVTDSDKRMDKRMKKLEDAFIKIDEIKSTITPALARVGDLEKTVHDIKCETAQLETSVEGLGNVFDEIKTKCLENKTKLDTLNERLAKLEKDCSSNPSITPEKAKYLEDTVLDLQCRSMKNNLIFTGLGHSHNEECELKLRDFIYKELKSCH